MGICKIGVEFYGFLIQGDCFIEVESRADVACLLGTDVVVIGLQVIGRWAANLRCFRVG